MAEQYANFGTATLLATLSGTSTATTWTVSTNAGYPANYNFHVTIDNEICLVTAGTVSSGTYTMSGTRGYESTTVASHTAGAVVLHALTADAMNQIRSNIHGRGTASALPATGSAGDTYQTTDDMYLYQYGTAWASYGPVYNLTPPPALSSWTYLNTVTGSLTTTQASNGSIYMSQALAGGAHVIAGIYMAAPATPFSIVAGYQLNMAVLSFSNAGIMALTTNTGSIITWGQEVITNPYLVSEIFTNTAAYSGTNYRLNGIYWQSSPIVFMKWADNGTTRSLSYSLDGVAFTTYVTQTRTTALTPTNIGVFLDNESGVAPNTMRLVHWLQGTA